MFLTHPFVSHWLSSGSANWQYRPDLSENLVPEENRDIIATYH